MHTFSYLKNRMALWSFPDQIPANGARFGLFSPRNTCTLISCISDEKFEKLMEIIGKIICQLSHE